MITTIKKIGIVALALVIAWGSATVGYAADSWVTTNHTVTVTVPQVLSISSDAGSFTLPFQGYAKAGDESWAQTVNYTVESNNMSQADGSPAINANLDFAYDRIDLKADMGSYTKTSGNTSLVEAQSGFVTIGTSNVALANKSNTDAGTDGKLLNGTFPVTYKAVATSDVPAGDQTHILSITLTTI